MRDKYGLDAADHAVRRLFDFDPAQLVVDDDEIVISLVV